jgi:fibro-slime domain-containing protein
MTLVRLPVLIACTGPLALAGASAAAPQPPSSIQLNGVARDFQKDHPDFDVTPADGAGHYAGNVALDLGSGDRPAFLGNGFKVAAQWRNAATDPIAPHLYSASGVPGQILLAENPSVQNNVTLDTWNSALGPYGGANVGPAPTFQIGATMPVITPPANLGPSSGNVTLNNTTLSSDLHCDDLTIDGTVQVSGNRTILCDGGVTISTHADMELLPGATLKIYVTAGFTSMPHTNVNAPPSTGLPGLVTIYMMGTGDFKLSQPHGVVYAAVVAPDAVMRVMPNASFFGTFTGKSLELKPNSAFHVDTAGVVQVMDACGTVLNDAAGAPALTSSGDITSSGSFDQWYRDILGVNVSRVYPITLERNGAGVYEYLDDAFYLLDGQGFGNEGEAHNNNFTFTIDASFTYDACAGQFLELTTIDDGWIFIGEDLVIDLGGIEPGTEQVIELDRLHLTDGQGYTMRLFYAHRHGAVPVFHLRTNIELQDQPEIPASVTMFFD